jgi:hypothetical protein
MNLKEKVRDFFHTNEDLRDGLDAIVQGLGTGTPEQKQFKLYTRVQALAKAEDLDFDQCWNLLRSRHPEIMQDEDLTPHPFAPRLMRRADVRQAEIEQDRQLKEIERKKQQASATDPVHQRRMVRIQAMQDRDPELLFASAWEATETEELPVERPKRPQVVVPRPAKAPLPDVIYGEDPPLHLPPGVVLIHAIDDGR